MNSRPAPAPPASTRELLLSLRRAGLLTGAQARRLARGWAGGDPKARLDELVAAGVLTPFQARHVLAGKAPRLRLGPYTVLDRLGAGGMGTVYKAEHVLMKRLVALKVLRRGPNSAASAAAFRREARAAARLAHPNVVTAYDACRARGRLFLVTEYVDGVDLQRLVARAGPLPIPLACEAVRQAALALQYLHERGLVHRDVKPSNLLLLRVPPAGAPDGLPVVKLLDLGLARRAGVHGPAPGPDGTPDYLAPERGHGSPADVRSDLYSLGCTFYFLLTGSVPFPGGNGVEKLLRHSLDAPTPVRELRPEVPPAVASVVERLMARDPADRFPTPSALASALGSLSPAGQTPPAVPAARPPLPRRRHLLPAPAHALAAVALGVALAWGARGVLSGTDRPADFPPAAEAKAAVSKATPDAPFQVQGRPEKFTSLAEAVELAPDGGTVLVRGERPLRMGPLAWRGKALTIRAARGHKPCLELRPGGYEPGQALLSADRDLTLRGLELRDAPGPGAPGTLVHLAGGSLRLEGCRLRSAGGAPPVVLRQPGALKVRGCRVEARAVGVSVEVGPGAGCRLTLEGSVVEVAEPSGSALSLWAPEAAEPGGARLSLADCTFVAGRVLAFRTVGGPLTVRAAGNTFSYREALLSCDGYPELDEWQRRLDWQGRDNRYARPGAWLRAEGRPVALAGTFR